MRFNLFKVGRSLAIDLGTANTLVCIKGRGIVVREPSVVAIDKYSHKVLAVGNDADEMLGRTPENIAAIHPLKDGVIADIDITEAMMRRLIHIALGKKGAIFKPRVTVCVPTGITNVEKRAVVQALMLAGAKAVTLIEEPIAAALGAGIDVMRPEGNMIVDIGGGTCETAVIALGGVVSSRSVKLAGGALNSSIINYIKHKYALTIGDKTAEEIKHELGSAVPYENESVYEVRGRDSATGLPKNIAISATEVREAIAENIASIIEEIRDTLGITPAELTADVLKNGITLTGGGALIKNIDKAIEEAIGVPVKIAEAPLDCVVLGTELATENENILLRSSVARHI
ncbi:MAG: rod shape-determining protein [Firmicutes bacterium]|nr:rod shape-determining protein [Bacillota bacterium]HAL62861.1 rod shape-determining protein [Clostridiales bacterium]